jgi:(2Fe-2S) ferredoxin
VTSEEPGRTVPFRCADAARERRDPLLGTAPVTSTYLLIEHAGPWRFDALAGAGWSSEVTARLTEAVRVARGRLLLVRRPGRRSTDAVLRWAVVRVGLGSHWGRWREDADLEAAADALRTAQDRDGEWSPEPILLVCAHGVHDTCCAIRGRPVAAALAERWPDATWECTHVGGDRFAANLVLLPDGTYYGGVDVDDAAQVVDDHLGGRVDVSHLRGSARWPPVAQVAVAEIHRRQGPCAVDEVRATAWHTLEPGRWQVTVSGPGAGRHLVEVVASTRPAATLTCLATRATAATSFRADRVSSEPAPEVDTREG